MRRLLKAYSENENDNLDPDDEKNKNCIQTAISSIKETYRNWVILPESKKLKTFHLFLAITILYDFYLTGLILGNYEFQKGNFPDFLGHEKAYLAICSIQVFDIVLNFFKINGDAKK